MRLIILQGPPAAGKSTWVKNYLNNIPKKVREKTVVVSRDAIRDSTGTYWVPNREDYISELEMYAMRNAFDHGMDVINDATNLNPETIKKLVSLAHEYKDIEIKHVPLYIPFKEALARDANRERPVGKKVLESFYQRYFKEAYEKELFIDDRYMLPMNDNRDCVICDLDGTLAIHTSGRSPFHLHRVKEDTPNEALVRLLNNLSNSVEIVFMSGREDTGNCRSDTYDWLKNIAGITHHFHLIMRKEGDNRPDQITKKELYEQYIKENYNVIGIFDDRNKVVSMWRELGLPCYQVYEGDF